MCELFGVSSAKKLQLNGLLREFFSHGTEHPHGWGMAFFYGNAVSLEKQPEHSCKSIYLKQRIRANIEADKMIAHIRLATRGTMDYVNTHPFVARDNGNRTWTLAHNGTMFDCAVLNPFIHSQQGQTDSERILLYIISRIDKEQTELKRGLSKKERFWLINEILHEITPENKVNLLLFDGDLLYVHTNYQNSLYQYRDKTSVVVSTRPLDRKPWEPVPMNQLLAYQNGELFCTGTKHENEFFDSEEKMRLLFLDFAAL